MNARAAQDSKSARKKSDIKILVVEDDKIYRESVVSMLQRSGYDVAFATGGTEALKLLEPKKFDVILSDIRMPEGDGLFLLDSIRAIDPNIPILIFLTGFGDTSVRNCLARGAHRVLSKPCLRTVLLGAIEEALALPC